MSSTSRLPRRDTDSFRFLNDPRNENKDVRAESVLQKSSNVRFNAYAKIIQIRCTREFASFVARYLGVTNFCVTRFVASGQKPDVYDLIYHL